jgi:hypothetical protein
MPGGENSEVADIKYSAEFMAKFVPEYLESTYMIAPTNIVSMAYRHLLHYFDIPDSMKRTPAWAGQTTESSPSMEELISAVPGPSFAVTYSAIDLKPIPAFATKIGEKKWSIDLVAFSPHRTESYQSPKGMGSKELIKRRMIHTSTAEEIGRFRASNCCNIFPISIET